MINRFICILAVTLAFSAISIAQETWNVPATDAKKISPFLFTDEMKQDGGRIFENSCASCHGIPGMGNFAKMSPSPDDPAKEKFQNQTDGSLFHKIRKGRGIMPSFENVYSEEETWSLVAYIRDFNKQYVQTAPVSTGEKLAKLSAKLSFDDNLQNLVVKVLADSVPEKGINVTAFVRSRFGMYALAKATTNNLGIAFITVDNDLPTDTAGKLAFMVKVNKGLATIKVSDTLVVGEPNIKLSVIEGRHLWSTPDKAPVWLKFVFWGILISIWSTIIYIAFGLLGLKKIK